MSKIYYMYLHLTMDLGREEKGRGKGKGKKEKEVLLSHWFQPWYLQKHKLIFWDSIGVSQELAVQYLAA